MTNLLIGAAAIALVAGTGSFAQPAPTSTAQSLAPAPPAVEQHRRMMMMADKVMTRDETVDHVRKLFARLDTNRDGFLTREETDAAHTRMMGAMGNRFAGSDVPMPDRAAAFARLDANRDGTISRDEFMAARPEVRQERVLITDGAGGKSGLRKHGFGMMGRLFEMADANRDGRVSLAEATDAAARHFDQADLNRDGKLTPDERRQAHQTMRGRRG